MEVCILVAIFMVLTGDVFSCCNKYGTTDPSAGQLLQFLRQNPAPIGNLTTSTGVSVTEEETFTLNSPVVNQEYFLDLMTHFDAEMIPARVVHAKGNGAFGYFEVTNDVSKYTRADIFNQIGKRTSLVARFSLVSRSVGGSDLPRDNRGFAVKFYTNDGILDLTFLQGPVFFIRDPIDFPSVIHASKRNPRTNLFDNTAFWDFLINKFSAMGLYLFLQSDLGIPNGYTRMDAHAIHTYELRNSRRESYYARFHLRTEQGVDVIFSNESRVLQGDDLDYFGRDLYNSIDEMKYPSWRLEMDILTAAQVRTANFDPFDSTALWKEGSYETVTIGRLTLNKNPDNFFDDIEQVAFCPSNLVPGIPGPIDALFTGRKFSYRDTRRHRLGVNNHNIPVNAPKNAVNTYLRDGSPPVNGNMGGAPNYYPNSFSGPVPVANRDRDNLTIFESSAQSLDTARYLYSDLVRNDGQRQRMVDNFVTTLQAVTEPVLSRAISLLKEVDQTLGSRVAAGLNCNL